MSHRRRPCILPSCTPNDSLYSGLVGLKIRAAVPLTFEASLGLGWHVSDAAATLVVPRARLSLVLGYPKSVSRVSWGIEIVKDMSSSCVR